MVPHDSNSYLPLGYYVIMKLSVKRAELYLLLSNSNYFFFRMPTDLPKGLKLRWMTCAKCMKISIIVTLSKICTAHKYIPICITFKSRTMQKSK